MGKDETVSKGRKPHSFRPYDVSDSFVQRVTSKVSRYLPQPSWFNRLLNPTPNYAPVDCVEEEIVQAPKRMRAVETTIEPEFLNNIREQACSSKQVMEEEVSPIRKTGSEYRGSGGCGGSGEPRDITALRPTTYTNTNSSFMVSSTPAAHPKLNGEEAKSSETGSYCSSFLPRDSFSKRDSRQRVSSSLSHMDHLNNSFPRTWNKQLNSSTSSLSSAGRISFDSVAFCNSPFRGRLSAEPKSPALGIRESEFYTGRTKFGGASSCSDYLLRTRLHSETPVTIKPTEPEVPSKSIASSTEKILNALKRFSTPMAEGGVRTQIIRTDVKKLRQSGKFNALMIPQMPDLLRIKRREGRKERPRSALSQAAAKASSSSSITFLQTKSSENRLQDSTESEDASTALKSVDPKEESAGMSIGDNAPLLSFSSFPTFNTPPLKPVSRMASTKPLQINPSLSDGFLFSKPEEVDSGGVNATIQLVSIPPDMKFSEPWSPFHKETGQRSGNMTKEHQPSFETDTKSEQQCDNVFQLNNAKLEKPILENIEKSNVDSTSDDIMEKFKLSSDQWVCSQCWVTNNNSAVKCVACEQLKTVESASENVPKPKIEQNIEKKAPVVNSGFGDKFKPPKDSWECNQCLVNNKGSDMTCIACLAPKSGPAQSPPLSAVFKQSAGMWECPTCLIQNKASDDSCLACETAKPGTDLKPKPLKSDNQFSFSVSSINSTAKKYTFGVPPATMENKPLASSTNSGEKAASVVSVNSFGMTTGSSDITKPMFGVAPDNNCFSDKATNSHEMKNSGSSLSGNKSFETLPKSSFKFSSEKTEKSPFTANDSVASSQFCFSAPIPAVNDKPATLNPFSISSNADSPTVEIIKETKVASPQETTAVKNIFGQVAFSSGAPKPDFGINNVSNDKSDTSQRPEFFLKGEEKPKVFKFDMSANRWENQTAPVFNKHSFNDSKPTESKNNICAVNSSEFSFNNVASNKTSDEHSASRFKHINFGSVKPQSESRMNSFHFNLDTTTNHRDSPAPLPGPFNQEENPFGRMLPVTSAPSVFGAPAVALAGPTHQPVETTSSPFVFGSSNRAPAPFTFSAAQPGGNSGFSFGSVPQHTSVQSSPGVVFDPNTKPNLKFTAGVTPNFSSTSSALNMEPENRHPMRKIRKAVRRSLKQ